MLSSARRPPVRCPVSVGLSCPAERAGREPPCCVWTNAPKAVATCQHDSASAGRRFWHRARSELHTSARQSPRMAQRQPPGHKLDAQVPHQHHCYLPSIADCCRLAIASVVVWDSITSIKEFGTTVICLLLLSPSNNSFCSCVGFYHQYYQRVWLD